MRPANKMQKWGWGLGSGGWKGQACVLFYAVGGSGALAESHNAPSEIFACGVDGLLRAVRVRAVKPSALLSGWDG